MAIDKINMSSIPGGMRNMYIKAQDVINKNNFDYGVELLKDLIQAVPGFWEARELLRNTERIKTQNLAGFQKMMGSIHSKLAVARGKMLLLKNAREALNCAEEALAYLYNSDGLYLVYEAAKALDTQYLAVDSLDKILELEPDNEKIIRELIDLISDTEGYAVRILQLRQKIAAMHPKDLKAQADVRAAAANATMEQAAEKSAAAEKSKVATKDNGTNTPDLSDLERGDRIIRSEADIKEMIRRYEEVIAAGKGTEEIYRKVADFYLMAKMYEKAIHAYRTLAEKQGVLDLTVDRAIEKAQVALANEQLEELINSENPEQSIIDNYRQEIVTYQINSNETRVKNNPNDLQSHYDLAMLYFENKRFDEAIAEFQIATQNPQRKSLAETYIGRSYIAKKEYEQAETVLKTSLETMLFMDTQKMRTLYYLGTCYELMEKTTEAADCFLQIHAVNPNYMDVAQKVKEYNEVLQQPEA